MCSLLFPIDCRVGLASGSEPAWHSYTTYLPEGCLPSEAVRHIGADFEVLVKPLSAVLEKPASGEGESYQPAVELGLSGTPLLALVTTMPMLGEGAPESLPDGFRTDGEYLFLGTCTEKYRPIQNADIGLMCDAFVTAGRDYLLAHPDAGNELNLQAPAVDTVFTLDCRRQFGFVIKLGGFGVAFKPVKPIAENFVADGEDPPEVEAGESPFASRWAACLTLDDDALTGDGDSEHRTLVEIQVSNTLGMVRLVTSRDSVVRAQYVFDEDDDLTATDSLITKLLDSVPDPDDLRHPWLDEHADMLREADWMEVVTSAADRTEASAPASQHAANILDDIECRLLITTSHDGSSPMLVRVITRRVVCNNTLQDALADSRVQHLFRVKHMGDTKGRLANIGEAMSYLVSTMRDEAQRLADICAAPPVTDEEADMLFGLFFSFGEKLGWAREMASGLWREAEGYTLLGAEKLPANSLWRWYNVVTQILTHAQDGADGADKDQQGAGFAAQMTGEYRGGRGPAEASAFVAQIVSGRNKLIEQARELATEAARKKAEREAKREVEKAAKS